MIMGKYLSGNYYFYRGVLALFLMLILAVAPLYSQILPVFSVSKTEGCVPLIVDFMNLSIADTSKVSVKWQFGNGNQSTEKIFTQAAFTQPGEYQVILTIIENGIEYSTTQKVVVFDNPKANFYADVHSGCVPLDVKFYDSTTVVKNKIVSWVWNFGDGTGSLLENPTNIFKSESKNNVTLIVVDEKGCKGTIVKDNYIIATQQPAIDFTYSDTLTCKLPLKVNFTENIKSDYPYSLKWDFGNNSVSTSSKPSGNFLEEKTYPVSLTVTNNYGCSNKLTKNITINEEVYEAAVISDSKIGCAPFTYAYSVNSNFHISKYAWEIAGNLYNAPSGSVVLSTAGKYIVKLTASDESGCSIVVWDTINVSSRPVAEFTLDQTEICTGPVTINFQNATPDATMHRWTFSNGVAGVNTANPSVVFTKDGLYNVQYIATNEFGCSDTILKKNLIKIEKPILSIGLSSENGCVPFSSAITLNKIGAGQIKDITWTYPNGNTYNGFNPPDVTLLQEGTMNLLALVEFDGNCPSQTISQTVMAGKLNPFNASFTPTTVCVKEGVGGTIQNPSDGVIYTWHLGDGQEREGEKISYEYSDVGFFQVSVVAEKLGCTDSVEVVKVQVLNPQAGIAVSKLCNSGEFRFSNKSLGNSYSRWDFGDGKSLVSNAAAVNHVFADTGTYKVKLYVENDITKCKDSVITEVKYGTKDNNIQLQPQIGCLPYTANFSVALSEYKTLTWTFNDTVLTGKNVAFKYNQPGVYDIRLVATRNDGCQENYFFPEIVTVVKVEADFSHTPSGGCAPINVSFEDKTSSDHSKIVAWNWDLGGQKKSTDQNLAYTFTSNNDVDIRLIATDEVGCKDTVIKVIPIYVPVADFTTDLTTICTGVSFAFKNLSKGVDAQYLWSFSNGVASSTDEHPQIVFNQEGVYDVKLVVVDANNCKDSIIKPTYLTVKNYEYDFDGFPRFKSCPELVTSFQILPSNISYKYAHWDFGDGNQSLDTNRVPVNIYAQSGVFDVSLILEDFRGCKDTIVKSDFVEVKGPRGKLSFTPTEGCIPLEVKFEAEFVDSKINFWDFGTGIGKLDTKMIDTVSHIYTDPGIAIPSLMLDDGLGCVVQLYYDTIILSGAKVKIDHSKVGICTGGEVEFTDKTEENIYAPIVSRWWEFGNGNKSNDISVSQSFTVDSTSIVFATLTVETELGCNDKDSVGIKVFAYPEIKLPEELVICKGDKIRLDAQGADVFRWEPARLLPNVNDVRPLVSPLEDTWFKVIGYDTSICASNDSVLLRVVNGFDAFAGPDTVLCYGDSIHLRTEVSEIHSGEFKYTWYLDEQVVSQDQSPDFLPEEDAVYIVNVRNGACKEYSQPVYVRVSLKPELEVYRDTTIAEGQSLVLSAISEPGVTYQWAPAELISCTNCASPTVSPLLTTNYKVIVTNEAGCTNESDVWIEVVDFCAGSKVEIPNVFSPNFDGLNDHFRIKYDRDLVQLKSMKIFNRYGELIFDTLDTETGWDGTFNTVPVNTGVYVYYIDVVCFNGGAKLLKGNITLMR